MVFQQGRGESGDRGVVSHSRLLNGSVTGDVAETGDERRWKPFSTSCYSTVTLLAKVPSADPHPRRAALQYDTPELQWNRK